MKNLKFRIWDKQFNKFLYQLPEKHHLDWERFDVQQFTGLTDKLGKEIYEGDVVRIKDTNQKGGLPEYLSLEEVRYEDYRFIPFDQYPTKLTEVIGNIYENELLTKK